MEKANKRNKKKTTEANKERTNERQTDRQKEQKKRETDLRRDDSELYIDIIKSNRTYTIHCSTTEYITYIITYTIYRTENIMNYILQHMLTCSINYNIIYKQEIL